MELRVVTGDRRMLKQSGKQPGADGGNLVQVQGIPRSRVIGALAEGAFGHDGEHAGAGRGLQHDVAGPDGSGLQRGVGKRQGSGELLQGKLFLRPPCLGRLQRCPPESCEPDCPLEPRDRPVDSFEMGPGLGLLRAGSGVKGE